MEQTFRTCFGALPISSTRFCAERNLPTSQSSSPPMLLARADEVVE